MIQNVRDETKWNDRITWKEKEKKSIINNQIDWINVCLCEKNDETYNSNNRVALWMFQPEKGWEMVGEEEQRRLKKVYKSQTGKRIVALNMYEFRNHWYYEKFTRKVHKWRNERKNERIEVSYHITIGEGVQIWVEARIGNGAHDDIFDNRLRDVLIGGDEQGNDHQRTPHQRERGVHGDVRIEYALVGEEVDLRLRIFVNL